MNKFTVGALSFVLDLGHERHAPGDARRDDDLQLAAVGEREEACLHPHPYSL